MPGRRQMATDSEGAASGTYRMNRGGGWGGGAYNCRAASRSSEVPGNVSSDVGFRPARSSVP
jgi:formylglycine-generating enzyme required for sulfatase activity